MKHLRAFFALSAFAGTLLLAAGSIASSPPRTISVGGYLADPSGAPLEGTFTFRVDFYGNPGGPVLDTVDTTTTLAAGTFSIPATLSDAVLDEPEVSYRVWADVDRDGLTESDRFPDVFKLSAVPRAHRTTPADSFRSSTLTNNSTFSYGLITGAIPTVGISPIEAPATGLRFNTVTIRAITNTLPFFQAQNETHYEVGIYDRKGELLVKSRSSLNVLPSTGPPQPTPQPPLQPYIAPVPFTQIVVPETHLQPGTNYTAFTSDINGPDAKPGIGYAQGVAAQPEPFMPQLSGTIPAPGGVLPPAIESITGRVGPPPGPGVILEYLPEAEGLPIGAYRRSGGSSLEWVLPTEKSFY